MMHNLAGILRSHYLKILAVVIVLVVPAVWLAAPPAVLTVTRYKTGEVLFEKGMQVGETFTLKHVHSITERPVEEVFYVKDSNTLALKEMRYDSFGSNLPAGPEEVYGRTTTFSVEKGYYKITYPNRTFDRVPLRIGKVIANHRLLFEDGSRLRFLDVARGGTSVNIYVRPFWDIF